MGAPLIELCCRFIFRVVTEDVLSFASRIESIAEAVAAVTAFAERVGFAPDELFGIDIAAREAIANAVVHGNKEDAAKKVEITLREGEREFEILIRDEGEGFDPASVPDPTATENLLATSGRGLLFIRNFMDEVEWIAPDQGGTTVRLMKRK